MLEIGQTYKIKPKIKQKNLILAKIKIYYILCSAKFLDEINGNPKYYLQIGNWIYPLIPDVSPCYHSKYGSIILPDITSEEEGIFLI